MTTVTFSEQQPPAAPLNPTKFVEQVPRFSVDLDAPADTRWNHILKAYKPQLKHVLEYIRRMQKKEMGEKAAKIAGKVAGKVGELNIPKDYTQELRGMAKEVSDIGMTYYDLYTLNIGYNVVTHCTSIVTEPEKYGTSSDAPLHLRNMDWDVDAFRDLTIEVDFVKNKKPIFRCTTWLLFNGMLTGMRLKNGENDGYSISLNYRKVTVNKVNVLSNLLGGLFKYWPLEYLIRHCLETYETFEDALQYLSGANTMAPCYLVVAGIKPNQGALISKARHGDVNRLTLNGLVESTCIEKKKEDAETITKDGNSKYVIQTNIDHWKHSYTKDWAAGDVLLLNAIDRRKCAEKSMHNLIDWKQQATPAEKHPAYVRQGFHLLSVYPVCNAETVYQVVMQPATNTYISKIVYNPPTCEEHNQVNANAGLFLPPQQPAANVEPVETVSNVEKQGQPSPSTQLLTSDNVVVESNDNQVVEVPLVAEQTPLIQNFSPEVYLNHIPAPVQQEEEIADAQ